MHCSDGFVNIKVLNNIKYVKCIICIMCIIICTLYILINENNKILNVSFSGTYTVTLYYIIIFFSVNS